MKKKKELILSIIAILGILMITLGSTYAFFNYARKGTVENSIKTGSITFLYTETAGIGKGISIRDAYPISDIVGGKQIGEDKVFDFKVVSNTYSDIAIPYEITARKKTTSTLEEEVVKVYLTKVDGQSEKGVLLDKYSNLKQTSRVDSSRYIEKTIYEGKVPANSNNYEENYRLRMWIDESTDFGPIQGENGEDIYPYNGKEFTLTVNVYANGKVVTEEDTIYKENLLNGADPILTNNLIPVTIDDDGKTRKADTSKEWYSYEKKNWANAVVLKDDSTSYENNSIIPEENIESYFVWIPRYKYKIFNTGEYEGVTNFEVDSSKPIEIIFEDKNTIASAGSSVGEYLTHPAFRAFETNGFWVGKFETGYEGAESTTAAQVNSNDSSKIVVKPNVYSWRSITVGNAFEASYNYLRSEDSHMMKNTEWGAVAYLTSSNYGRCENGSCSEVRINNNKSYITGYAGVEAPTLGYNSGNSIEGNRVEVTSLGEDGVYTINYFPDNQVINKLASTTQNKSGIYDMSGGAWEYVMGYTTASSTIGGSSEITSIHPDFFTNNSWNKYYDIYTSTSNESYSNRILGDATGEMGPFGDEQAPVGAIHHLSSWYHDYAHFISLGNPWFARGGYWGTGSRAGSFAFSNYTGTFHQRYSFRIILTP